MAANTDDEVTKIAKYGAALLDKFCYRFKGVDIAGQVYNPSSETLDESGELSVCGLRYNPFMDTIITKYPTFHNGRRVRGKPVAMANKKNNNNKEEDFIIKEFKDKKKFTVENLQNVYKDVPKTLRFVASLASQPYDIIGLQSSLLGQPRHTVSTAMKTTKGTWESKISEELWEFVCCQLIQLHLTCQFDYPRIPNNATTANNSCDLLIL
jgi:hypothetical protein